MPWCRSYGCRESVERRGDYCGECEDALERLDEKYGTGGE